ncbi:flagellar motor protein MotB [Sagittula salina]|uniref:OmpA family protein n=1 Tax=Sagittula salina TaxID=2820268 RepID=A0A940MN55_9RHOB|nr:flagellar motor protein MotB [Sagittula salina]MBP0484571.1 OmpA family protein [Sagittula salina]
MASNEQPIIIKRVEEDSDHGHHGGGWKVAYADFMTAMMAFFLLLWILASSDEEKLQGLADYFSPSLSQSHRAGDGLLDGTVTAADGAIDAGEGAATPVKVPTFGQENPLAVFDSRLRDQAPEVVVEYDTSGSAKPPSEQSALEAAREAQEATEAAQAESEWQAAQVHLQSEIMDKVVDTPALRALSENLRFERTSEGLEIQLVDRSGSSMFDKGSSRVDDLTRGLLSVIADAVADLPNDIMISGHTDSVPYSGATAYSNWELSADRAAATRRVLVESGVGSDRIARISGVADTDPLDPDQPDAPENRRISITIAYPKEIAAPAAQ